MLRLLLFAILAIISDSWVLESTHSTMQTNTTQITQNVTIRCHPGSSDKGHPLLKIVMIMAIFKRYNNEKWFRYAKINHWRRNPQLVHPGRDEGVVVKGRVRHVDDAFLSVTWSLSSQEATGQYSCTVNGYHGTDDEYITSYTNTVTIEVAQIHSINMLNMIVNLKRNYKQIQQEVDSLKAGVQFEMQNMTSETARLKEVLSYVKSVTENGKPKWPGGRYALLNTVHGSHDSADWSIGYIRIHSESSMLNNENYDEVSNPSHLATPIFEHGKNNFFYIRTRKHDTDSAGPAWPKGNYCVHRVAGTCPTGFKGSRVGLDTEGKHPVPLRTSNPPDIESDESISYVWIFFCCRHDGRHDEAISLPVTEPFFLYRFKGQCQKVKFARVTEEWFQIHTDHHSKHDKCEPGSEFCPDSTLNPPRFQVCHYRGFD